MTGPIQPLPIPDVRPIYFDRGPSNQQVIHSGIKSLVDVLLAKQNQDFEQQKLNADIAQQQQQQATDNQTGQLLQQLLPSLARPATPGGSIAPIQGTGMIAPITVAPDNTATRLSSAFAGRPGTVIAKASGLAANSIQQAIARENATPKPTGKTIDKDGFVYTTYADGSTKQQMTPDGKPIVVPSTVRTPFGTWQKVGINGDKVHWRNFATGQDYTDTVTAGTSNLPGAAKPNAASQGAAGYLIPALNAYDRLRTLGPLNIDPVNYIGAFKLAATGHVADVTKWMAQNAVSTHDRAIIETMIPFVQAVAHSQGGKRITDAQLQQYIQSLTPFKNDAELKFPDGTTMLDQKDRVQRSHLLALYYQAQPSLQGRGIPDLEAQWPDLADFHLGNGRGTATSQIPGVSPDNPFAAPQAPSSAPPMLRRP